MRIPRIYHPQLLTDYEEIALSAEAANHVVRVLRMSIVQALALFDGSNQVCDAKIVEVDKKSVQVRRGAGRVEDFESPLCILAKCSRVARRLSLPPKNPLSWASTSSPRCFLNAAALRFLASA